MQTNLEKRLRALETGPAAGAPRYLVICAETGRYTIDGTSVDEATWHQAAAAARPVDYIIRIQYEPASLPN
jgi:hypothetical protein